MAAGLVVVVVVGQLAPEEAPTECKKQTRIVSWVCCVHSFAMVRFLSPKEEDPFVAKGSSSSFSQWKGTGSGTANEELSLSPSTQAVPFSARVIRMFS